MPEYTDNRPYDITRVVRQNTKDIEGAKRFAKGSAEYAYAVSWIGTGSPADGVIGNGSLNGYYRRLGSLVFVRINMTLGSTSVLPGGSWGFTVPVVPIDSNVGSARFGDTGTGSYVGTCTVDIVTNPSGLIFAHSTAALSQVHSTNPFAWTASDTLRYSLWYTADDESVEF